MKMVFGLGNPGREYVDTRHNVGFLVTSALAENMNVEFADKPKFGARIAETVIDDEKVLLVQPQTFYNEVGRSYRSIIDFYKLDPSETLIVHDELALPFGTIRSRVGGSDAGNNGIKSINSYGGESSARVRVGIGNEMRQMIGDTDFVLGKFSAEEQESLRTKVISFAEQAIGQFIEGNHTSHSQSV